MAAPLLPYADLPSRWGVTLEQTDAFARISIAPLPGWIPILMFYRKSVLALGSLLALLSFFALRERPIAWDLMLVHILVYGLPLLGLLAAAFMQTRRTLTFEIDAHTVTITNISALGGRSTGVYARQDIGQATVNRDNGKLRLRIIGRDMLEWFISPNREVAEYVAQALDRALRSAFSGEPPARMDEGITLPPPRWLRAARITVLVASTATFLAGLVLMLSPSPLAGLGFYLLVPGAAGIGITLGTQKKEFWV